MGVLYEHWRTDLNECFYVGISWAQEDTRPYDLKDRNYRHLEVQDHLNEQYLKVEIRVQKFDGITQEKLGNLEKLMIAHWRQYIGNRLTNIHPGGGGHLTDWDDEMRNRASERMAAFYSTPAGQEWLYQRGKKHSEFMQAFLNSPEGEIYKLMQSERMVAFLFSSEGETYCQEQRERALAFYSTPEGISLRNKKRELMNLRYENLEERQKQSERQIAFLETEAGKEKRLRDSERMSGENNPMNDPIIKQKQLNNVPKGDSHYIHSNPEHLIKMINAARTEEARTKNSLIKKAQWENPEYRMKMLVRSWYNSNVLYQKYWGA